MLKYPVALGLLVSTLIACEPSSSSRVKDEWNQPNNPVTMMAAEHALESNYSALPKKGRPERMPWSDNYWPTYQGGVAYRWNWEKSDELSRAERRSSDRLYSGQLDENPEFQKLRSEVYGYKVYTKDELLAMKAEDRETLIQTLSPAEKYDIYRGRFDYPTVTAERERTGILQTLRDQPSYVKDKKIETWFGICHAWAPATIMFKEPAAVSMTSKDQIQVDFGASDVKALLSHMIDADSSQTRFNTFMGVRCNSDISQDNITRLNKDVFGALEPKNNEKVEKAIEALRIDTTIDAAGKAGLYAYILAYADTAAFAQERYTQLINNLRRSINARMQEDFDIAQANAVKVLARAGAEPLTPAERMEGIRASIRTKACSDTNAGAFHLVLANLVGLQGQSFGVDITRDREVWNQAVAGYVSTEGRTYTGDKVSPTAAAGTVKEVEINTTFYYTGEMSPAWEPFSDGTTLDKRYHQPLKYHYKLELDAGDNIIGGSWLSDERPDFLWGAANVVFSPAYADLKKLYYKAIQRN